ncbi:MAG: hypothetical protein ROZ00_08840 [Denitratisoma sp.]|nr:hypothetical protein [Denitratisoma sp.]
MKAIGRFVSRLGLRAVFARPCGSSVARSGEEGEKANCFFVAVDKGDQPYLAVEAIDQDNLKCLEWNGSRFQIDRSIPLSSFSLRDFRITHYYGLSTIEYQGILDLLVNRLTAWPYIKVHVVRTLSRFDQFLFNKKKLITKQRMELLQFLVGRALDGKTESEPLDLMTDLYSLRWVLHPDGEQQQQRLEFYLESLVETGDLKKINYKYIVAGRALKTIEEYEEQERKHTENVKMQWRTFWLAYAVAFLTAVQAGLVKLPTIIDWATK